MGAIHLKTMTVFHQEAKKGQHMVKFLEHIRSHHPPKKVIHLILDRASYHRAQPVVQAAERLNIRLHYLPPYSPNPIELLWKVMNQ